MSETTIPLEDFLEHFGVLGMKWGKRKSHDIKNRALEKQVKKVSRREEKRLAFEKQVNEVLDVALKKQEMVLVKAITPRGAIVMTGKEFVDNVAMGMPLKSVSIYAQQKTPTGKYILEPNNKSSN